MRHFNIDFQSICASILIYKIARPKFYSLNWLCLSKFKMQDSQKYIYICWKYCIQLSMRPNWRFPKVISNDFNGFSQFIENMIMLPIDIQTQVEWLCDTANKHCFKIDWNRCIEISQNSASPARCEITRFICSLFINRKHKKYLCDRWDKSGWKPLGS